MKSVVDRMIKASNEISNDINKAKEAKTVPQKEAVEEVVEKALPTAKPEEKKKSSEKSAGTSNAAKKKENQGGRKALPEKEKRKQFTLTMKQDMRDDIMEKIKHMNAEGPIRKWSFSDLVIEAVYEYFKNHNIK